MAQQEQTEGTYQLLWRELRRRIANEVDSANNEWYTQHAFIQAGNLMDQLEGQKTPLRFTQKEMATLSVLVMDDVISAIKHVATKHPDEEGAKKMYYCADLVTVLRDDRARHLPNGPVEIEIDG